MVALDVADPVRLTAQLIDIPSVSGDEKAIADAIERTLRSRPHLRVDRDGDAVVARTDMGHAQRVVVAGHIDTVPLADNGQHRFEWRGQSQVLWGRGSVDMLGGVAMALHAACELRQPKVDVTYVFYDHEEVEASLNGLGRIARHHPQWLDGDFAILGEPTNGLIEGGCNGTIRLRLDFDGRAAHSARSWRGDNAIHKMAPVIERIAAFGNPEVEVDGLRYRESLSVVRIGGGIAGNVIPDRAQMWVNYRFAPSRTAAEAIAFVTALCEGSGAQVTVDDESEGARPGLDRPIAQDFVAAVTAQCADRSVESERSIVGPKYGWTDVARFSAMGVPALNFGPGDPMLAHTVDEHVPVEQIERCARTLVSWLSA